jgi:hypothetical protein
MPLEDKLYPKGRKLDTKPYNADLSSKIYCNICETSEVPHIKNTLFCHSLCFIVRILPCGLRLRVLDRTHFNLTHYEIYAKIIINKT